MNDKTNQVDDLQFDVNIDDDRIESGDVISNEDESSKIKFEDIGGLHRQKECLKEMIVFPCKYKSFVNENGIKAPKGVIFYGPPGTGKTLLARALANECLTMSSPMRFMWRRSTDFFDKFFGESERKLRALFKEAQKRPTILFIDELDGLCQERCTDQNRAYSSLVCTLLSLMDGLESRGNIIVIGATNRLDTIDEAIRRPGRFDRELYFPLPDLSARKEILRIHSKSKSETLINRIAEITQGYSGAELESLCTEAVFSFLKRKHPDMHQQTVQIPNLDVQLEDYENAKKSIKEPSFSHKGSKIPEYLEPLFEPTTNKILNLIKSEQMKKLLIIGDRNETKYICDAVLNAADFHSLFSIELLLIQNRFDEIYYHLANLPLSEKTVIWLGDVNLLEDEINKVELLLSKLNNEMDLLILGKSDKCVPKMFSEYRREIYRVEITREQRKAFYEKILSDINDAYESSPKKLRIEFSSEDLEEQIMSVTEGKDCESIIDLYWALNKLMKTERRNDIMVKILKELDRFQQQAKSKNK